MALTTTPEGAPITQDGDEELEQTRGPGQESDEEGSSGQQNEDDASGQRRSAAPQRTRYQPLYGEDVLPNGALPSGKGIYAQKLAQIGPQEEQYEMAARLLAFLKDTPKDEISDINNS